MKLVLPLPKGKRVVLTRHRGLQPQPPLISDVGIFDTLGYLQYENANELDAIIRTITDPTPSLKNIYPLNTTAPVYLIAARLRTDAVTRIISEAKLFFRSFDPQETPRLSAPSAFEQVAQSFGVLVHLLPERIADSPIHNMQSAFLAGLADGFEKVLLILQDGEASVITSKAANDYHFKTGQCEVAGTFMFYLVIPCRGKFNL